MTNDQTTASTTTPSWLNDLDAYRDHYEQRLADDGHKLERFNLNRMRWFTPRPEWTILDLGCGTGASIVEYARRGHQVVGVDVAQSALTRLRIRITDQPFEKNVKLVHSSIEDYRPPAGTSYDAVLCCDVLEHVIDMKPVLETAQQCLRPGGLFYVTAPAVRVGQAEHVRGVGPSELVRHLVDMGFDNIQTLMPWNRPELPHYPLTICTAYRQEKHR